jgi:hypothetical protein
MAKKKETDNSPTFVINGENGEEQEELGVAFINKLYKTNDNWKQTSYNTCGGSHKNGGTPFRKNYAGKGFTYNETLDAFMPPPRYPSWTTVDEVTGLWNPPVAFPDDGRQYRWDEETTSWEALTEEEINSLL